MQYFGMMVGHSCHLVARPCVRTGDTPYQMPVDIVVEGQQGIAGYTAEYPAFLR